MLCPSAHRDTFKSSVFAGEARSSACIFVAIRFLNPVKACRNAALPDFLFHQRKPLSTTDPDFRCPILSMGMTSDFEVAVEEGATMVRVGTAVFGKRNDKDGGTGT